MATRNSTRTESQQEPRVIPENARLAKKRQLLNELSKVDTNGESLLTQYEKQVWEQFVQEWRSDVNRAAPERFRDALRQAAYFITRAGLDIQASQEATAGKSFSRAAQSINFPEVLLTVPKSMNIDGRETVSVDLDPGPLFAALDEVAESSSREMERMVVEETIFQRIARFIGNNWQWMWTAIFIPIAMIAYRYWSNRRQAQKPESKPTSSLILPSDWDKRDR